MSRTYPYNATKPYSKDEHFDDLLCRIGILKDAKDADYNRPGVDPGRFVSEWLNLPIQQVFLVYILTKVSRLVTLSDDTNAIPKVRDESFTDTCLDLTVYALLLIQTLEKQRRKADAAGSID